MTSDQDFATWESWKNDLARMHEDLTGLEQSNECFDEVLRSLAERRSRFAVGLFGQVLRSGFLSLFVASLRKAVSATRTLHFSVC